MDMRAAKRVFAGLVGAAIGAVMFALVGLPPEYVAGAAAAGGISGFIVGFILAWASDHGHA